MIEPTNSKSWAAPLSPPASLSSSEPLGRNGDRREVPSNLKASGTVSTQTPGAHERSSAVVASGDSGLMPNRRCTHDTGSVPICRHVGSDNWFRVKALRKIENFKLTHYRIPESPGGDSTQIATRLKSLRYAGNGTDFQTQRHQSPVK